MKSSITSQLAVVALLLINLSNGKAQNMQIRGIARESFLKKLTVNYILKSGDTIIAQGETRRINADLELNREYTLILYKEGYYTRYIHFSTNTPDPVGYLFDFKASMSKKEIAPDAGKSKELQKVNVYYDQAKDNFNYALIRPGNKF